MGTTTTQLPTQNDPDFEKLIAQLKRDETLRLKAYDDKTGKTWTPGTPLLGKLTIAYGRNLNALYPGLDFNNPNNAHFLVCTEAQADQWLRSDARKACAELSEHLPWVNGLNPARRGVLQNMMFNLGPGGLLGFHNTLHAVSIGDWREAAEDMLASRWAQQVGQRAVRLANQMLTGEWQ